MNISSKELKKMARNQLSGKYGTFIGTNVLYILITLVASNLMDLVLGTSSILNPLTATSATVETLGISHTVVYYLSTFILSLILSLMFSQTMFFLTDYIDIEAIQALKESVRIMRGKKGKLFYLQLSFIGIYLLGAIACGIGLLWVIPYMQVTMANFYRKITGEI